MAGILSIPLTDARADWPGNFDLPNDYRTDH